MPHTNIDWVNHEESYILIYYHNHGSSLDCESISSYEKHKYIFLMMNTIKYPIKIAIPSTQGLSIADYGSLSFRVTCNWIDNMFRNGNNQLGV